MTQTEYGIQGCPSVTVSYHRASIRPTGPLLWTPLITLIRRCTCCCWLPFHLSLHISSSIPLHFAWIFWEWNIMYLLSTIKLWYKKKRPTSHTQSVNDVSRYYEKFHQHWAQYICTQHGICCLTYWHSSVVLAFVVQAFVVLVFICRVGVCLSCGHSSCWHSSCGCLSCRHSSCWWDLLHWCSSCGCSSCWLLLCRCCCGGGVDGVKTKLSLLLPTLPVACRGYEWVVKDGVVSSTNETKGWMQSNL